MRVSGHEDWTPEEIADRLMGDDIPTDNHEGLHGAVIVLCKRVAELELKLQKHQSTQIDMENKNEIYVVVAENDQPFELPNRNQPFFDDGGPLVFEQYTRSADLKSIKKRAAQMRLIYGKCRIARLEFIDEDQS